MRTDISLSASCRFPFTSHIVGASLANGQIGRNGANRGKSGNRAIVNRQWAITIFATRALSLPAATALPALLLFFTLLLLFFNSRADVAAAVPCGKIEILQLSSNKKKKGRKATRLDSTRKAKAAQRSAAELNGGSAALVAAATAERRKFYTQQIRHSFPQSVFPRRRTVTRLFRFSSSFTFFPLSCCCRCCRVVAVLLLCCCCCAVCGKLNCARFALSSGPAMKLAASLSSRRCGVYRIRARITQSGKVGKFGENLWKTGPTQTHSSTMQ